MRVAVTDVVDLPDHTAFKQILSDLFIDLPDIGPLPVALRKVAVLVDGVYRRKAFFFGELKIFFTVSWSQVDDTGTVFGTDVLGTPDLVRIFAAINKERLIAQPDKVLPL